MWNVESEGFIVVWVYMIQFMSWRVIRSADLSSPIPVPSRISAVLVVLSLEIAKIKLAPNHLYATLSKNPVGRILSSVRNDHNEQSVDTKAAALDQNTK
jgi:hypothetical protein